MQGSNDIASPGTCRFPDICAIAAVQHRNRYQEGGAICWYLLKISLTSYNSRVSNASFLKITPVRISPLSVLFRCMLEHLAPRLVKAPATRLICLLYHTSAPRPHPTIPVKLMLVIQQLKCHSISITFCSNVRPNYVHECGY